MEKKKDFLLQWVLLYIVRNTWLLYLGDDELDAILTLSFTPPVASVLSYSPVILIVDGPSTSCIPVDSNNMVNKIFSLSIISYTKQPVNLWKGEGPTSGVAFFVPWSSTLIHIFNSVSEFEKNKQYTYPKCPQFRYSISYHLVIPLLTKITDSVISGS